MILLIKEDKRAPIFISSLEKKFPKSSRIYLTRNNIQSYMKLLKAKPTLTKYWFTQIDEKVNSIQSILETGNSIFVVRVTDRDVSSKMAVAKQFDEEAKFINVVNLTKDFTLKYIQENLDISMKLAEKLASRSKYYAPTLFENVTNLKMLRKEISNSDIDMYTGEKSNITLYNIFFKIIGFREYDEKELAKFIYQFRYALPYIKKRLLAMFRDTEKVYMDIEDGLLGKDNANDYIRDKKLSITPHTVLLIIEEIHKEIDYERLILSRITVERVSSVVDLLSLI